MNAALLVEKGIFHGRYYDYPNCCRGFVRHRVGSVDSAPPHTRQVVVEASPVAGGLEKSSAG